ncbi:lysosome membrane protein 2 [Drosophila sulfurigaster albostrigata]|uniref:lysosome membrane protein 2 n=1 Tax=Drosophila sulfurigaster albostrigata TaxID=89887 RepID=UPI002D21C36A|nr:lysosome membrane protein 2 [Drosophila sulfurigaster albostrigata]
MKLFANKTQRNAKLLRCAAFGMTLVFLGAVIFMTNPVQHFVEWQLSLTPGTLLYKLWLFPPLDVYIMVYMFNYTNVDDFIAGRATKLKVEQVGPYVYKEVLSNHNVTLNEANNTISYTPRREYIFIRDRSVGDPHFDRIRAPNIPYMGVSTHAASLSMFAALGISALTKRLNAQPMLEVSVHDYMWGYEDHLVHLASKFVPSYIDFASFGIMEKLFREGNESNVVNMHLPERRDSNGVVLPNSPRGYSLHSVNYGRGFMRWDYDEATNGTRCNRIWGSHDATLFPRDMNEEDEFFIYRRTFCRRLPLKFVRTLKFWGQDAFEYTMEPHIFDSELGNVNSSCFCKNNQCLRRGVGNVAPCYYNMPLAITYPHFMHTDPSLLERFDGLKPNESIHTSTFMLQPQLGVPLHTHMRLQANQVVGKVKFNRLMEPFENMVLPLLWVDLTIDNLPVILQLLVHGIKYAFPLMQGILALGLILAGLYQLTAAFMLCFWSPPGGVHSKIEHAEKAASIINGLTIGVSFHKATPTAAASTMSTAECVQEAQKLLSRSEV